MLLHKRIHWNAIKVREEEGTICMYPLDANHRLVQTRKRQDARRELFREFRDQLPPSVLNGDVKLFRSAKITIPREEPTPKVPQQSSRFVIVHQELLSLDQDFATTQHVGEVLAPDCF
jgi:hypothetical protein